MDPCTSTTTKESSTRNTLFHVWSEKEKDILGFHRNERNDDFPKKKITQNCGKIYAKNLNLQLLRNKPFTSMFHWKGNGKK